MQHLTTARLILGCPYCLHWHLIHYQHNEEVLTVHPNCCFHSGCVILSLPDVFLNIMRRKKLLVFTKLEAMWKNIFKINRSSTSMSLETLSTTLVQSCWASAVKSSTALFTWAESVPRKRRRSSHSWGWSWRHSYTQMVVAICSIAILMWVVWQWATSIHWPIHWPIHSWIIKPEVTKNSNDNDTIWIRCLRIVRMSKWKLIYLKIFLCRDWYVDGVLWTCSLGRKMPAGWARAAPTRSKIRFKRSNSARRPGATLLTHSDRREWRMLICFPRSM